jgi:serine/threonine protein kinase
MCKNYMSREVRDDSLKTKRLTSKRESCHNSIESKHISPVNKLKLTQGESIVHDREKLVKFIKLYVQKHNKVPPTTLDFYKIVKLIGKGAFGKVTLGIHKLTGKHVAIKTIEKSYMKDEFSRRKVFQEVYILKKIRHSNIIRLYEVFESSNHLLMVMEFADKGDLLQHVKSKGKLSEKEARHFFKHILYGLGHCHCRSVLHRDVKLDNILIDGESGVKICDFGVSKIIEKNMKIIEQ